MDWFLFMYGFDPVFLFGVLPALLFTVWAQIKVKSSFNKYSREHTMSGITGAQAAAEILRREGITDVRIEQVPGHLSDHFDPRANVIRLSPEVYGAATVAAVGVAAHEAGHAIQYAHGYVPIKIRTAILPVTSIGSSLAMPLILLGFFLAMLELMYVGIILFGVMVVFQLVTLPVEFNASRRAIAALEGGYAIGDTAMLTDHEVRGSRKVLTAAALTYVAALAVSLMQLLRFLAIARRR